MNFLQFLFPKRRPAEPLEIFRQAFVGNPIHEHASRDYKPAPKPVRITFSDETI